MAIIQYPLVKWLEMNHSEFSSMHIGFDGDLYLLTDKSDKAIPHRDKKFIIKQVIDPENILVYDIPPTKTHYHFVQPLPDNQVLLITARARYYDKDNVDLNAHIYNSNGELQQEFCLGDGIEDVQTTSEGLIWTSYFDEGVFGNYGWRDPLGSQGLNQWNIRGELLYQYQPKYGLDIMTDCYALNVTSKNEIWCYYYTDFPLVRLLDNQVVDFWEIPIKGASSFVVWKNYVLFNAGYERDNIFTLLELEDNHQVRVVAKIQFTIEYNQPLIEFRHRARGNVFFMVKDSNYYRVDLRDILYYLGLPR